MSAAAAWGAVGTGLASYFGYRAQKKYLDWLKQFYAPELEAKKAALPALKNLVLGYYLSQVGKPSELLKSQHLLNLEGIGREEARGLRTSQRYWSLLGNTGRGRGEQMRLGFTAERTRNLENLGYGQSQEQYLSGKAAEAMSGLQMLATLGQGGNPYVSKIAELGMKPAGAFWGDMNSLFQNLLSIWTAPKPAGATSSTGKPYQGDVNVSNIG